MFKSLALSLIFVPTAFAFAGASSSGGGPSIVCTSPQGVVTKAEDYDLFEAKTLFGIGINYDDASVETQLNRAASKLTEASYFVGADFRDNLNFVQTHQHYLPDGIRMSSVVSDLGTDNPPVAPAGCSIEYVGYYNGAGSLMITKEVFAKLSPTDQAAFYAHEALYRMARNFSKATNSQLVRKLNTLLWSNAPVSAFSALVPAFTWNGDQEVFKNKSRLLKTPVILKKSSTFLSFKLFNPDSYSVSRSIACLDENLKEVSFGSEVMSPATESELHLPYSTDCKLLRVIIQLNGTMGSHPNFTRLGVTISDLTDTLFNEFGQGSDGLMREEFYVPVYHR